MLVNSVTFLFLGAVICTIGAVPFGLVNLSVMDVAINQNVRKSMSIAHGAAIVEILFASTALLAGTVLSGYFNGNILVKYIVLAVLIVSGIYFWFKQYNLTNKGDHESSNGFLKGTLLNLMSIQVLLFWLFAVTFLSVRNLLPSTLIQFSLFISGVWFAKMTVLRAYAILGKKVAEKSQLISRNMNRIIGSILILVAFIQLVKL